MPAVRAKPGNPGYGFRRARWRNTTDGGEDQRECEQASAAQLLMYGRMKLYKC